jgi:hypothetical protein
LGKRERRSRNRHPHRCRSHNHRHNCPLPTSFLFFSLFTTKLQKKFQLWTPIFQLKRVWKILFVCELSTTTLQAIKSSQKSPYPSFFWGTCQMLGVRTSSSCTGLSTFHACQRRNSSSIKEGSFQSSSISCESPASLSLSLSHTHTHTHSLTQRRSKLDGKGNGHKHIFLLLVVWEFLVDQICLRTRFLRPSVLNNEDKAQQMAC